MTYQNNNSPRPKLTAISSPGEYLVKVCKIRDEDVSFTQKNDAKVKVLLTTKDSTKVNDTFFGSTDGALKRAAAFVGTATGKKVGLPGKSQDELRAFLSQAEGYMLKVTVVQEEVTFSSGEQKLICKVTKFHPCVNQVDPTAEPGF
jgi:hypothetical protein